MKGRVAGIEAGGESFLVAIAEDTSDNIVEMQTFGTTTPDETLGNIEKWLADKKFDAIGIACFGPIDLDRDSSTYGYITTTPKKNWKQTNIVGRFSKFNVPIAFDTDVNGAAMAQYIYTSSRNCVYVTVGTGVGVGIVAEGNPIHGALHPEMGHIFVRKHPKDSFEGSCPFHKSCLEGMIATGALSKRFQCDRTELPNVADDHEQWQFIGYYLAQLCNVLVLTLCPNVIILGGGVMKRKILFPIIRRETLQLLNGYIDLPHFKSENTMEKFVIPSPFGSRAGIIGALEMGRQLLSKKTQQSSL